MPNLYAVDLHINPKIQEELKLLASTFSGTVIYVDANELEVEESKILLENIIKKGLNMNYTEVYISTFNSLNGGLRVPNLKSHLNVKYILSFGIDFDRIGLNISADKFQVLTVGGFQILLAPTLKEISNNKALKISLWQSLKTMFNF